LDWNVVAAIATPILAFVGVVVGHWSGRRAGLKQADAAVLDAESSARIAVTADWKSFSDALQVRLAAVESRSAATETRLDAAELRASAAETRASHAEGLYKAAVKYLRQIAAWFDDKWPGEKMPPPPEELEGEL
jgi:hypothetical protein